jgi:hypothetical protein
MRAQFLSRFEHAGKDVYSYLDLDTQEIVWLEAGRSGLEIKRWPKMILNTPKGRAIDYPPREDITKLINKYHNKSIAYPTTPNHDHWAF